MQTIQTRLMKQECVIELANNLFAATDKMRLYKSTFVPSPASTLADFQANEVVFTGYGPFTLADGWTSGLNLADQGVMIYPNLAAFSMTGPVLATDIAGGWWIENTGGTAFRGHGQLDSPAQFQNADDTLFIKPVFELDMDSDGHDEFLAGI